ncbi:DUF2141 domain-containing protein [Winogradskyella aquimaris]|uniref:DUF2141 domain-containing protein n=1 Tax=Winogradskyella aquimaris TaxID=864074 RepID=A0ABU5ENT4_9FLAO|nr:DUF2141 domain-containing protein [Winogradskyella aquimaris]MDY2588115.1 DUF2141 domain-containing protein [Winogradskyella aquimaris]
MHNLVKIATAIILSIMSSNVYAQETFNLTVKIEDADSNDGQIFVSVYNTAANFLDTSYKGAISKITNNGCVVTFEGLPKGTYAVSTFHDENDNGKLDTNFIGIPKEDYGCSNGAKGIIMGPPKWKDAKFELQTDQTITITL